MKKLWPFEDDCAKLNGNVAAVPHFATVGHIFGALHGAQIMHTICRFESWEVRSLILQTIHDLELKRKRYGRLKMSAQSWAGISQPSPHFEGCFAAAKPPFGTRVPLRSAVRPFHSCEMGYENPLLYKILFPLRKRSPSFKNGMRSSFLCFFFPLWLRNGYKMISKLQNGCKMISKL